MGTICFDEHSYEYSFYFTFVWEGNENLERHNVLILWCTIF